MPTSSAGCTCSRMSVPIALMPPPPCEPVHMRCAQCVALVLLFCLLGLVLIATIMLVAARLAGVPKVANVHRPTNECRGGLVRLLARIFATPPYLRLWPSESRCGYCGRTEEAGFSD